MSSWMDYISPVYDDPDYFDAIIELESQAEMMIDVASYDDYFVDFTEEAKNEQ